MQKIKGNINLHFKCGQIEKEEALLSYNEIPCEKEGLFVHEEYFPIRADYHLELRHNKKTLSSTRGDLQFRPTNFAELVSAIYANFDKRILGGGKSWLSKVLERALPDIKTHYDVWYHFYVTNDGTLFWKLHIGPSNSDNRIKIEGNASVIR